MHPGGATETRVARAVAAGVIATAAGVIATAAGGVGGPGKATTVALPGSGGVAFAGGYLYIAGGGAVRKVSPQTDWLATPVGTGVAYGPLGDGAPAGTATVTPGGVAADAAGNLVIADTSHSRVRVVAETTGTFYGQAMTAGDIYTVAGGGTSGLGDGGPATSAKLSYPQAVAVDAAGNLVIADTSHNQVRVVAETTGTFYGQAMTAGDIYTVAGGGTSGLGDGGPATSAKLSYPQAVAVDAAGNLVIADTSNSRVRVVAASTGTFYGQAMTAGDIYTVAGGGTGGLGDGGPATSATLSYPAGVAVDAAGDLLIADTGNGRVRLVAAATGTLYTKKMTAGDIYTVAGNSFGHFLEAFSGDGGPATRAELSLPAGIATDAAGNLAIADTYNDRVRLIAATSETLYGQAMTAGDIYTVAGTGKAGFAGDGGPATSAKLLFPAGVTVDAAGNLVIADTGNNRARVVAETTGTFYGQALTAGDIYTVAGGGTSGLGDGGPATSAKLSAPQAVAVDTAGNLVIADTGHNRIRAVAETTGTFYGQALTAGDISTVAGTGKAGFAGDGGPATNGELNFSPHIVKGTTNLGSVAVDPAGNLVIADTGNNRIRIVAG